MADEQKIAQGPMYGNGNIEFYPNWLNEKKLAPLSVLLVDRSVIGDQNFIVTLKCLEFTTLCNATKLPDYGVITITVHPQNCVVETKSLKEYLASFRDKDMFQEEATLQVFNDMWTLMRPRFLKVEGSFNNRGGIEETVSVARLRSEEDEE